MLRIFLAAALSLLGAGSAIAGAGMTINGGQTFGFGNDIGTPGFLQTYTPPSSGYTGPGDIITSNVVMWNGFRCYSNAYSGNVALINNSTTSNNDTIKCSSGGILSSTPDSIATIKTDCTISLNKCTLTTLYDQSGANSCSGACNMTIVGTVPFFSNCPVFTVSVPFCAGTVGGVGYLQSPLTTLAQPWTWYVVGYYSVLSTNDDPFVGTSTEYLGIEDNSPVDLRESIASVNIFQTTVPTVAWFSVGGTINNTTSYTSINATLSSVGVLTMGSLSATGYYVGAENSPNAAYVVESGVWAADDHSSLTTLHSNASSYYGGGW